MQIVYVSSAVRELSVRELADLLRQSRERNAACGITGLLAYANGNFFQVIEGPEPEVEKTFARIQRDPRHTGLITLLKLNTSSRCFAQWSMAFENITRLPGYSDFATQVSGEPDSPIVKLIRSFTRNMNGG